MSNPFRVYWNPDEIGPDGYPYAWHKPAWEQLYEEGARFLGKSEEEAKKTVDFFRTISGDERESWPAIKDLVRERDGHRCLRCHHPYRKGEHTMETYTDDDGEQRQIMWTRCDERCTHFGPRRIRRADGGWIEYNAPDTFELEVVPGDIAEANEIEASWRILTVHHLNGVKHDCRWWNLVSLCQRCHLTIQGKVYMERPWRTPHSEWFKPFAAAFYAWKYLDQELTLEQTMERLDELLELELRQDALF